MKRFASSLSLSLGLLVAGTSQASAARSAQLETTPSKSLSLKLKKNDAERLRGDTLQFVRAGEERYRYVLHAGQRTMVEMDLWTEHTATGMRDTVRCDFGGSSAVLWFAEDGNKGSKGKARAVRRCTNLARSVGDILAATPTGSWTGPGGIAATDPGSIEAGISCKVATTGPHEGKCLCKCDHGWNPAGALFCSSFYLTMHIGGEGCHVGVGCEAPLSACAE